MDLIPIGRVEGDGSVHFLRAQSGIELLDGFRGLALPESDHDGVERNAQRAHAQHALGILSHIRLRWNHAFLHTHLRSPSGVVQ
jgi:hypothetical protein